MDDCNTAISLQLIHKQQLTKHELKTTVKPTAAILYISVNFHLHEWGKQML